MEDPLEICRIRAGLHHTTFTNNSENASYIIVFHDIDIMRVCVSMFVCPCVFVGRA